MSLKRLSVELKQKVYIKLPSRSSLVDDALKQDLPPSLKSSHESRGRTTSSGERTSIDFDVT
jgi:hypothetical protein